MVINFIGKRGSGKTTLIRGNLNDFPGPVAVVDILGNFNDPDLYQVTTDVSEFIGWLEDWKTVSDEVRVEEKEKRRELEESKIFVLMPSDVSLAVDFVSSALWHIKGGTLVLDETDAVDFKLAPCFDDLVRYGRNHHVHLITGCRRPAEISRNITAAANKLYALRTQEPRDVEFFEKTILGKRARELMQLPEYHGLLLDYDEKKISKFKFDKNGTVFLLDSEEFI